MFNTVRRMTDTNLTLFPLSKVTYRVGYSQNIFQGPSLSPSGYQFAIVRCYCSRSISATAPTISRARIDWKPVQGTKLTFEEQIDHYKADSYFTLDPSYFIVQEADGTKVALLANYDSLTPYASQRLQCKQHGHALPMLSAPQTAGGLPVINPACAVVTSYLRSQPTRILYPTEIFRLQSSSIKNISMNGDVRYTNANMNLPNYYDSFQGLSGTTRSLTYTAHCKRQAGGDGRRLWHRLAGRQRRSASPIRLLLERPPARNHDDDESDHRGDARDRQTMKPSTTQH